MHPRGTRQNTVLVLSTHQEHVTDKITACLDLSKTHVPLGHASFVYSGRLQRSWTVFYLVLMFWQLYTDHTQLSKERHEIGHFQIIPWRYLKIHAGTCLTTNQQDKTPRINPLRLFYGLLQEFKISPVPDTWRRQKANLIKLTSVSDAGRVRPHDTV